MGVQVIWCMVMYFFFNTVVIKVCICTLHVLPHVYGTNCPILMLQLKLLKKLLKFCG